MAPYYIGAYEVTYELWYTVRCWGQSNGYSFAGLGREGNDGTDGADPTSDQREPVTMVSWRDAAVWCNAYSEMSGYTPCYYTSRCKKNCAAYIIRCGRRLGSSGYKPRLCGLGCKRLPSGHGRGVAVRRKLRPVVGV